jgi:hypothetical protein
LPALFDLLKDRQLSWTAYSLSEPAFDDDILKKPGRSLRDTGRWSHNEILKEPRCFLSKLKETLRSQYGLYLDDDALLFIRLFPRCL